MANLLLLQAPKKSAYAISPPSKCASRQVEFRSRLLLLPSHNLFLEKLPLELMPAGPLYEQKGEKKNNKIFPIYPFRIPEATTTAQQHSLVFPKEKEEGKKKWLDSRPPPYEGRRKTLIYNPWLHIWWIFFGEKKDEKITPGRFFRFFALPHHRMNPAPHPTMHSEFERIFPRTPPPPPPRTIFLFDTVKCM